MHLPDVQFKWLKWPESRMSQCRDRLSGRLCVGRTRIKNNYLFFRPKFCKISCGENELFPLHSFGEDGLCLDNRLQVDVLEVSNKIHFKYRTFRFQNIKTIDQRHQIHCRLKLSTEQTITSPIQNCTCYSNESCDSGAWSYWSDCDGNFKQMRVRNKDEADEETQSRDCQGQGWKWTEHMFYNISILFSALEHKTKQSIAKKWARK